LDWYKHIVSNVESEYGCKLIVAETTEWINVPEALKEEIATADEKYL
jgi:hypothetical protein